MGKSSPTLPFKIPHNGIADVALPEPLFGGVDHGFSAMGFCLTRWSGTICAGSFRGVVPEFAGWIGTPLQYACFRECSTDLIHGLPWLYLERSRNFVVIPAGEAADEVGDAFAIVHLLTVQQRAFRSKAELAGSGTGASAPGMRNLTAASAARFGCRRPKAHIRTEYPRYGVVLSTTKSGSCFANSCIARNNAYPCRCQKV